MEGNWIQGMPPVLPDHPKVLILGSIPGVKSLEKQQYYGNPRNHFWTIMEAVFGGDMPRDYESRIEWIKGKQVALWDTIGACSRPGSLDSSIRNEQPNDIKGLLRNYPDIERILCNGGKSWTVYQKYFGRDSVLQTEVLKLPSTSPIPGRYTKSLDEKIDDWRKGLSPVLI